VKASELIAKYGKPYSELLSIDLKSGKEQEIFKWFLAAILFGKPIQESVAIATYKEFEKQKILTPQKILKAGWDKLVEILDNGGYVRYDFSTATKLLKIMEQLKCEGSLNRIHEQAKDKTDLEKRIQMFEGIGPVTTNIFLRELRAVWKKADPEPLPVVKETAKRLKINLPSNRKSWYFVRLECALFRARKLV